MAKLVQNTKLPTYTRVKPNPAVNRGKNGIKSQRMAYRQERYLARKANAAHRRQLRAQNAATRTIGRTVSTSVATLSAAIASKAAPDKERLNLSTLKKRSQDNDSQDKHDSKSSSGDKTKTTRSTAQVGRDVL